MRLFLLALPVLVLSACPGPAKTVPCDEDADCDLSTGGVCTAASGTAAAGTGRMWCAYPDPACPSGLRFSDQNVGDGLGGSCTEGVLKAKYTLTVSVGGNGAGAVTSMPEGLSCSSGTCMGAYEEGTVVQLSATATTGAFLGWALECRGKTACAVTMDHDRTIGALFGTPGTALWAKQLGSTGDEEGHGIAVDTAGNVIAVGEFSQTVSGVPMPSAGGTDGYVVKVASATGNIIWAKRFGGASYDIAADVAIDAADNVYVTGNLAGVVDFGGTPLPGAGANDFFVMKLSPAGDVVWTRRIGGNIGPHAIAVRGSSVLVAGEFSGSMTVDTTTFTAVAGPDIFAISVSAADGATNWAKPFGGPGIDRAKSLAIDGVGNVVVSGSFEQTVNFGGFPLQASGESDGFLLKLAAANGAHLLSRHFGSTSFDYGNAVAIDAANNIFMTGQFAGTVDFGCGSTITANSSDTFLAKYSQAGACAWVKSFTGNGVRQGRGLTVNAAGDVAITGEFCGTISFGGPTLISASPCTFIDAFAARLTGTDGSHLNSARAGGAGNELGADIAEAPDGRFFVTGWFTGFAEFGGEAFTSAGAHDAFLLALAPL